MESDNSVIGDCLRIQTKVVHPGTGTEKTTGAISFPIYQTATFRHAGLGQTTGYDYSRLQNPTREELEIAIANLEGGRFGFAFSTGMAAISTIIKLFPTGSHLIVSEDLYGGTYRLFEEIYRQYGLSFTFVDTSDLTCVKKNWRSETKAIYIETPTNPMMKVTDIVEIAKLSHTAGCLTIVDNTFLTPYFQQPLALGADIVLHSGTKFLAGHNDTLSGFIVTGNDSLAEKLRMIQSTEGGILAPFDSWLVLRGIKTLGIRMEKQQENAVQIANWLSLHPRVEQVYYVGLPSHPEYELSQRQASGFGSMISFSVKDVNTVKRVLERIKIISFAESLGGVESLITYPMVQTHASIPEEMRNRLGIHERLLRLSVGIESVDDLLNDLEQAMR